MKSACLAVLLLGSIAMASPIQEEKRYMVTEIVLETVTITVTADRGWRGWGRSSSTVSRNTVAPIPTSSTTTAAVSTVTTSSPTFATLSISASYSSPQLPSPSASTSVSSTSSATQPTNVGSSGSVSSYADPIIRQHNFHRSNHSAPAIQWDEGLANIAQEIARSCVYAHNVQAGGGGYGQNIGAGAPPNEIDAMITNQMYNDEMMLYPGYGGEPDMSQFHSWGHFSQIVWKDTTSVGCFTHRCDGGLSGVGPSVSPYFTVCNYKPSGNSGNKYGVNVLQPQGHAVIVV